MKLLWVVGCLAVAAGMPSCRRTDYRVPDDMWAVTLVPAPHIGDPLLRVEIANRFQWPRASDEVSYQVILKRPGYDPLAVGRITEGERFAIAALPVSAAGDIDTTLEADRARLAKRDADQLQALRGLGERGSPVPADIQARAADLVERYAAGEAWWLADRLRVFQYSVVLRPVLGDRAQARQESSEKKAANKYAWGTVVADEKDPCKGKKPEDCALEKLKKIKDEICNAKVGGAPRFPKECETLTKMLQKSSPEPKIECDIPQGKGVTSGMTSPTDGSIRLNGEYFLKDPCADAAVIHELTHSNEFADPNKYLNLKKLRDAENRLQKANKDLAKAVTEEQKKAARDDLAKAMRDIQAVEKDAGLELVQTECNALFATIDNGEYFHYPGDGLAWMKENIKGMIGELGGIRNRFPIPLSDPNGPMCKCFTKIRDYVNKHDDIKKNFDKDVFGKVQGKDLTWSEALDLLTALYCKP